MFLSDRLVELGKESNPRNNLSQGEAANKMLDELKLAQKEDPTRVGAKRLYNSVVLACKELNKQGWMYFKPSVFFNTAKLIVFAMLLTSCTELRPTIRITWEYIAVIIGTLFAFLLVSMIIYILLMADSVNDKSNQPD